MRELVRTFADKFSACKLEILDALANARGIGTVRQIEITMTDNFKRRSEIWLVGVASSEVLLNEIRDFVEQAIEEGMREGLIVLTVLD